MRISRGGNIHGVSHLQNQNYLVAESLKMEFKMKRLAIKIPIIVTTIMMKIMKNFYQGNGKKVHIMRKTTCLLSIRKSLACARVSKLTTTVMNIARASCEIQSAVGSSGLNARRSYGRHIEFKFLAWSSIAQSIYSVCWRFGSRDPGSNPAFSRGRQRISFQLKNRLPVPEHRNQQQQTCISPEPGAKANR